jgi:Pilus formation protein N terminal region
LWRRALSDIPRPPVEKAKPMMLRLPLSLALFLGFGALAAHAASPGSPPDILDVTMDQAKIAKIPAGVTTLVIGNPIVADVTLLKGSGAMVVTGKGYGETNLLSLDAKGNVLDEKTVRVMPSRAVLVVQRGTERVSYACNPLCMPTVTVGDDSKQFETSSSQINAHNGLAQNSAGAPQMH